MTYEAEVKVVLLFFGLCMKNELVYETIALTSLYIPVCLPRQYVPVENGQEIFVPFPNATKQKAGAPGTASVSDTIF